MTKGPVLALTIALAYLVVPGAAAFLQGRARRVLVAGLASLSVLHWGVILVVPGVGPIVGAAAAACTTGLVFALCIVLLGIERVPFGTKLLATGAVVAALMLQWAEVLDVGINLTFDLANGALVWGLGRFGVPPGSPVIDDGVRWLQPSIDFLNAHLLGVGTFLTWAGALGLLAVLWLTTPWVFAPRVAPWSRESLGALRLPGRVALPAALVVTAAAGRRWPVAAAAAEILAGTYAAWGASALVVAARMRPSLRTPFAIGAVVVAAFPPLGALLVFAGLVEHVLDVRGVAASRRDPDRRASASRPFRGTRTARRYLVFAALYVVAFLALNLLFKEDRVQVLGPWTSQAYAEADARTFAPVAGMILQRRPWGEFWIDEYEYPSRLDVPPRVGVGFEEAEEVCRAAGKRLCGEDEWIYACEDFDVLPDDEDRVARISCAAPDPAATARGERARGCRSRSGVHGLLGGVWEWTSGGRFRVLKGSAQGDTDDLRLTCAYRFYVHALQEPGIELDRIGFRCCRDAVLLDVPTDGGAER